MGAVSEMSSRARIDQLGYVFLNGESGLILFDQYNVRTPQLVQFVKFMNNNPKVDLAKGGMAPMVVTALSETLEHEYSRIREDVVKSKEITKENCKSILEQVSKMNELLEGLSTASRGPIR